MSFYIAGTGSSLPEKTVSNDLLGTMMDTSDEWIAKRTGIRARHVITTETLTSLSVDASLKALKDSGTQSAEIDLVICATLRGDMVTPAAACMIAERLGVVAPAFDINAACSGFIYALSIAESFIQSGKASTVLVVTCEAMSRLVDWTDRASCVLFGDGAAAAVLKKGDGVKSTHLSCVPNSKLIYSNSFTGSSPFISEENPSYGLNMDGAEVYKFAVNTMVSEMDMALKAANLTIEDIDYVLPHQANLRIIDAAKKRFGLKDDKVLTNIATCGNMSATSVGVLLDEFATKKTFKKGDKLLFVAFGAGMTAASAVIEWQLNG